MQGVRVWDLSIRLFHWLTAGCLAFSWWSAEYGRMDLHYRSGMCLLALLAFRVILGFIGGETARFASFVKGPAAVIAQLRGRRHTTVAGHSPLSALSVIALLAALGVQIITGLFSTDVDGIESGPLSFLVSFDTGRLASSIHEISFNALLALTGLHIVAVLFYLVLRRRNYLTPMITGRDRQLDAAIPDARPARAASLWSAAAVAVLLAWGASNGFWM